MPKRPPLHREAHSIREKPLLHIDPMRDARRRCRADRARLPEPQYAEALGVLPQEFLIQARERSSQLTRAAGWA
jgi:hypothetical protein